MTGPSADAAAGCGDDTLSRKNKLERNVAASADNFADFCCDFADF